MSLRRVRLHVCLWVWIRLLSSESESSARIAELLAEVNEKTNTIEELQAQLEAAQATATRSEEALDMLHTRVGRPHCLTGWCVWVHGFLTLPLGGWVCVAGTRPGASAAGWAQSRRKRHLRASRRQKSGTHTHT